MTLLLDRYLYNICLTCCSEADACAKAEKDLDVPEDTQLSAEEEEQLQKKTGLVELSLFN